MLGGKCGRRRQYNRVNGGHGHGTTRRGTGQSRNQAAHDQGGVQHVSRLLGHEWLVGYAQVDSDVACRSEVGQGTARARNRSWSSQESWLVHVNAQVQSIFTWYHEVACKAVSITAHFHKPYLRQSRELARVDALKPTCTAIIVPCTPHSAFLAVLCPCSWLAVD